MDASISAIIDTSRTLAGIPVLYPRVKSVRKNTQVPQRDAARMGYFVAVTAVLEVGD